MISTPIALLDLLLHNGSTHTVESLALALHLPRATILAQIAALRRLGCTFDEHPQHGVRLLASGIATWVDYVEAMAPRRISVYRSTSSTQDVARQWVQSRAADLDRAVAVADVQSAGRGRLGRRWTARPGDALLLSYITTQRGLNHDQLTAASAVAVAQAIEAHGTSGMVRIKWPNDLLIDGRKVAGILVERDSTAAIVGIGINVAAAPGIAPAPGSVDGVTCLYDTGVHVDRLLLLTAVLRELDRMLAPPGTAHVDAWRSRCLAFTGPVRFQSNGSIIEGEVLDADPAQGLIVRTITGTIVHLPAATTGRV